MQLLLTIKVDVSDLPAEARAELMDGINFRHDDDETLNVDLDTVPRLSDHSQEDVEEAARSFFESLGDYDMQSELWGGTDCFFYFSKFEITNIETTR